MAKEAAKGKGRPKPFTKSQISAHLSEKVGVTKKQAVTFVEELANLAYVEAKKMYKDGDQNKSVGFTIPGLGKLVLVDRKARMGRNPKTNEPMPIPAKKVVRFRVAKAAKEAIAGVAAKKKK